MLPDGQQSDRVQLSQADGQTRRAIVFSVICVALLVTLANQPASIPSGHAHHAKLAAPFARKQRLGPPEKVKVRLYMESKCPACKDYSTDFLNKIIQKDGVMPFKYSNDSLYENPLIYLSLQVSDIIDFKFVPWGNARVLKDGHEINTTVALSELLDQVS
jgi:hypothetical protein